LKETLQNQDISDNVQWLMCSSKENDLLLLCFAITLDDYKM